MLCKPKALPLKMNVITNNANDIPIMIFFRKYKGLLIDINAQ